ncbi:MAG: hypothetical protein Rpha_1556 [Candidatus Ruthia sp. Apha_13_S6]|nr:hypothetical protein [Candidatus Ruthia sp. Apha_13_S6]
MQNYLGTFVLCKNNLYYFQEEIGKFLEKMIMPSTSDDIPVISAVLQL